MVPDQIRWPQRNTLRRRPGTKTPEAGWSSQIPGTQIPGNAGDLRMAPRAYWKGSLKLSLVSCPVVLYPASTSAEKIRFPMITRETDNRLQQQMVDAETGDDAQAEQKGRRYALAKNKYV